LNAKFHSHAANSFRTFCEKARNYFPSWEQDFAENEQLSWGLEVSSAVTMLEDRSMYCLPSVLFTEDIPK
jgi:hypothetical protein